MIALFKLFLSPVEKLSNAVALLICSCRRFTTLLPGSSLVVDFGISLGAEELVDFFHVEDALVAVRLELALRLVDID